MSEWKPSDAYTKVAEANRCFYAQVAPLYDATETCVTDADAQAQLESELDRVLALLDRPASDLRALDACGGSGNVALKLIRRGVKVTLADISPELLQTFRAKCRKLGVEAVTCQDEIARFLSDERRTFDLVVFSSALHHLQDIEGVLTLTYQRLAPGGILFTMFDPTQRGQLCVWTRLLLRSDYYAFKVIHQTSDLPKAAGRRLRRMLSGASPNDKGRVELNAFTAGVLAEYHVERGIDDRQLVDRLRQVGYEVVRHDRYANSRSRWIRRLVERMGDATDFRLVLRKPRSIRPGDAPGS